MIMVSKRYRTVIQYLLHIEQPSCVKIYILVGKKYKNTNEIKDQLKSS